MKERERIINQNEDKSITQIYKEHIKGSDLGMRKQEFLHMAKRERNQPLKSRSQRKKYIPKKYKKPEPEELEPVGEKPPATEYKTVLLEHEPSGERKFIRVPDPESRRSPVTGDVMNYSEQYWKILGSEGWRQENVKVKDTTFRSYAEFEDAVAENRI